VTRSSICFAHAPSLARCEIAAFRYWVLHAAAQLTRSARRTRLRIGGTWRWAAQIAEGFPPAARRLRLISPAPAPAVTARRRPARTQRSGPAHRAIGALPAQEPGKPWVRKHRQQRIKIEYGRQSRYSWLA
jgi:hypothetical protein